MVLKNKKISIKNIKNIKNKKHNQKNQKGGSNIFDKINITIPLFSIVNISEDKDKIIVKSTILLNDKLNLDNNDYCFIYNTQNKLSYYRYNDETKWNELIDTGFENIIFNNDYTETINNNKEYNEKKDIFLNLIDKKNLNICDNITSLYITPGNKLLAKKAGTGTNEKSNSGSEAEKEEEKEEQKEA